MIFFFFFSSRRRHTRSCLVSWARRCVQETGLGKYLSILMKMLRLFYKFILQNFKRKKNLQNFFFSWFFFFFIFSSLQLCSGYDDIKQYLLYIYMYVQQKKKYFFLTLIDASEMFEQSKLLIKLHNYNLY
eukprot:TRINITY_DN1275_c0_g1_i6.p2 TRINITY_DN1275_c0_g1~~TRINITY_DN1275_c0_g1_i6.p2  ORF type:complete len:130 (+),score=27.74 TRINITY_DN1275_c0_g1_i6:72-461(+)